MTNFDWVKSLSVDEFAHFMLLGNSSFPKDKISEIIINIWRDWLNAKRDN